MFTLPEDPYKALGVSKEAQLPEIRSAHRKLVLKCHPDKVTVPEQKAIKQDEFQKVQRAYELLSDDTERTKYDDMVRANEMEKSNARARQESSHYARTSPRTEGLHREYKEFKGRVAEPQYFNSRTAEPRGPPVRSSTFSGYPYARTPGGSAEDHIHSSSGESFSKEPRSSKKKESERDHRSSKRDEEKRRKKDAEREWERAQEKEKKEKERRKDEKRREDKKRLEDDERKRSRKEAGRRKAAYVEEVPNEPRTAFTYSAPESDLREPHVINAEPRADQVKSSSDSKREASKPMSEAEKKEQKTREAFDYATSYLSSSRSKVYPKHPSLNRAQTYHSERSYNKYTATPPMAAPTPPPHPASAMPLPPRETLVDDNIVRKSQAKTSSRRGSADIPRVREKMSSSHKKGSSRDPRPIVEEAKVPPLKKSSTMPSQTYVPPPAAPESPPRINRAKTEQYSRPIPAQVQRSQTFYEGDYERSRRPVHYSEEDSEDDRRYRRSRRRDRSPEAMPRSTAFRYTVDKGRAIPVTASYRQDSPERSYRSYYVPEAANTGRPLEHRTRPSMPTHGSYSSGMLFPTVRTTTFDEVNYSEVSHTPYRPSPGYAY